MKWSIPAKTFLLGEYIAIEGGPAIVLTTTPCFELSRTEKPGLHGIHPQSPAGRWWMAHGDKSQGLQWFDPYAGIGGLGASSAQFVGVYQATYQLSSKAFDKEAFLESYFQFAWNGEGLRPSGYDVLAQISKACVYIHQRHSIDLSFNWPFDDLAFVLLHTGEKLATHEYLKSSERISKSHELNSIVNDAMDAIKGCDSALMVKSVNDYYQALMHRQKVAEHSVRQIDVLKQLPEVLAVKGCGAMGADVMLVLVSSNELTPFVNRANKMHSHILATSADLYGKQGYLYKKA